LRWFYHTIGHDMILNINAQVGDDILALGRSRDVVVTEEHSVARGEPACIRGTRLVHICVDRRLGGGGGASQVEAKVQGDS
jgi:hypothetical protein